MAGLTLLAGCATPGPPKPPSLQIPAAVTRLEAVRRGGAVELGFDLPRETTDKLPYRGASFHAAICRAVEAGVCTPVGALSDVSLPAPGTERVNLRDVLPPELLAGPVRLLTYRVQLKSDRGKTAGYGDGAYSAAGAAPEPVADLRAEGSRLGVAVRWAPGSQGEAAVVLRRETVGGMVAPGKKPARREPAAAAAGPAKVRERSRSSKKESAPEEPGVVWLSTSPKPDPLGGETQTAAPVSGVNGVLDDSAVVGNTYRYAAERQLTAQFGAGVVVLHSALSAPAEVTLRAVYPPPPPTDLDGTLFPLTPGEGGKQGGWAVDLIWTPAGDPKTVGYNIVRTVMEPGHPGEHQRTQLNDAPVKTPSFHDVLPPELVEAIDSVVFAYYVTAVDANGLQSESTAVVVGKKVPDGKP